MRIVGWHGNLVNKPSTQAFNRASGREIVRVAGDRDGLVNRPDEWHDGSTRLQCVAMPSKTLRNLKSDVTSANPNVLRFSDTKIDVPDI